MRLRSKFHLNKFLLSAVIFLASAKCTAQIPLTFPNVILGTQIEGRLHTDSPNKSDFLWTQAFSLKLNFLSINLSAKQSALNFTNFPPIKSYPDFLSYTYSTKLRINPKTVPFAMDIFLGTISSTSSLSRMRQPALSISSALSSPAQILGGIFPQAASPSSTNTSPSLAFSFFSTSNPMYTERFSPTIQGQAFFNGDFTISIFQNMRFKNRNSFTQSFTASYLEHSKNSGDTWFLEQKYYPPKKYLFLESETYLSTKNFSGNLILGMNENPFGPPFLYLRSQEKFKLTNSASLSTGLFLASPHTITANGSMLHKMGQTYINPQLTLRLKDVKINTGLLYQMEYCIQNQLPFDTSFNHIARLDANLTFPKATISSRNTFIFKTQNNSWELENKMSGTTKIGAVKSTSQLGMEFLPGKTTLDLQEKIIFPKSTIHSLSIESQMSFKNRQLSSSFLQAALAIDHKTKHINITGNMIFKVIF